MALGVAVLWISFCNSTRASQSVTLAWNPESNVAGYALYYGTNSSGNTIRLDTGTNTTATVPGLQTGLTYYFAATAYNATGVESAPSAPVSYLVPVPATSGQSVTLGWNSVSGTNVAGYALYSGTNSGHYTTRLDAGTNTAATVSSLKAGLTYYFAAASYNAAGVESSPSAEIAYLVPGILALTPPSTSGNPMMITFPVAPGHSYTVQASVDLKTWTNLWQSGTSTSNVWVNFHDAQSSGFPKRFYRITSTP